MIFKIVQGKSGDWSVNQESNGYWWYHELSLVSREAAVEWCRNHARNCDWMIAADNYIPRNMR